MSLCCKQAHISDFSKKYRIFGKKKENDAVFIRKKKFNLGAKTRTPPWKSNGTSVRSQCATQRDE